MYKFSEYDTSSLTTGLYERFDPPRSTALKDHIGAMIDGIGRVIRRWYNAYVTARTRAALAKLDDFALHDIGLSSNDIAAAAHNAVQNPDPDYPQAS